MKKQRMILGFLITAIGLVVLGCSNMTAGPAAPANFIVTYDANNPSSGSAPSTQTKAQGTSLTLAANSGNLARTGYNFGGWNTATDGTGTPYAAGETYTADAVLALFAKWNVKTSSSTILASGLNPSTFGSSVTFTATVAPATATGTVTFKDGGTTLGTGALSDGAAIFSTSGLGVGSHGITAEYSGDGSCSASASAALVQTVGSTAAKDGNWNDPTTWSCGTVPEAGTNVTIGEGITLTLDSATATVGNLTILGTLTVSGTQSIYLTGDFTNYGTFNCGTGYVYLVGATESNISALSALQFCYLTMNKDTATVKCIFHCHFSAAKKFTLTKGTFVQAW